MKAKKAIFAALSVTLLMSIIIGCSGSGNKQEAGGAEGGESGSSAFKLWLGWTATINNDSLLQKYWKEQEPGVDVKLEATQGDALTALNLKINTGGFEDAAIFSRSDTVKNAMGRSKQIMSVEQYFDMPDKYPGLASIPKQYLELMKDEDGHIWSIPTWFDQNPESPWPGWASQGWFVRTDVLEKAGMTIDDLATIEGVEAFLREAAKQTDESGKALLPMSFLMDTNDSLSWNDEGAILAAFGVTTAGRGVQKIGDEFVFAYDDPNFKAAYQWMNKLYVDKLIDPEVVTNKSEQYTEKNKSGRVALNAGTFWNIPTSTWETLDGPTAPGWYYEVIPYPQVAGVEQVGVNQIINPSPGNDVYISKDTKNLDAILKFFDYALQPKADHQQVINDGPAGLYWDWVDQPLGKWDFIDEEYKEARNSGDNAQKAKVTPELYMISSFSTEWYPWWNTVDSGKGGAGKTIKFSEALGEMGSIRVAADYDLIQMKRGGVWEKYTPEVENIRKEYRAKLLMAKDEATFETEWNKFRDALEKRGHWSEIKQEWLESYEQQVNGK